MIERLTIFSQNVTVLTLVADFGKGLGCRVDSSNASTDGVQIELSDTEDLLELLDYVGLTVTKAGLGPAEPLCRLTYRRPGASAQVTLDLRIAAINLTS